MMDDLPPEPRLGCFKGCAFGCLVFIVVAVGTAVWTARTVVSPFKVAIESRERLEAAHGTQADYTPTADGSVPAERVERFLAVRQALVPTCERFAELTTAFLNIEALGEEEEPSKVEVMGQAFKSTQAAFRIAPLMGEYFAARNQALIDHQLGFGEYTYIYTAVYGDRFTLQTEADQLFGGDPLNGRVRALFVDMLRGQRQGLTDDHEMAAILDREIAALDEDPQRRPWLDGPPSTVVQSFEPFADRLDGAYCEVTTGIELLKNRERSFGIEAE